jgi:hypothetical protein
MGKKKSKRGKHLDSAAAKKKGMTGGMVTDQVSQRCGRQLICVQARREKQETTNQMLRARSEVTHLP